MRNWHIFIYLHPIFEKNEYERSKTNNAIVSYPTDI